MKHSSHPLSPASIFFAERLRRLCRRWCSFGTLCLSDLWEWPSFDLKLLLLAGLEYDYAIDFGSIDVTQNFVPLAARYNPISSLFSSQLGPVRKFSDYILHFWWGCSSTYSFLCFFFVALFRDHLVSPLTNPYIMNVGFAFSLWGFPFHYFDRLLSIFPSI